MKTIALKSFTNVKPDIAPTDHKGVDISSLQLIRQTINQPIDGRGIISEDLLKRLKILGKLDTIAKDAVTIDFEDADYEIVKSAVSNFPWAFICKEFGEFIQDINNPLGS